MCQLIKVFASAIVASCLVLSTLAIAENQPDPRAEAAKRVLASLNWIKGPTDVRIGNNAHFHVPEGYVFLNPEDTDKFIQALGNPPHGKTEYMFGPVNDNWFGVFSYEETGHVADDEKIDAAAVLEAIKQGTEEGNKYRVQHGGKPLNIVGWKYPPFYEASTKRLTWAILADVAGEGHTINFNTRILGRTGVTSAMLVAGEEKLDADVAAFNQAVEGYSFDEGSRYAEFRSGDKVAEYGLMALVAGGAGAAFLKSGAGKGVLAAIGAFFAAFWKIIAAAVIGLLAGFKKLFKKD